MTSPPRPLDLARPAALAAVLAAAACAGSRTTSADAPGPGGISAADHLRAGDPDTAVRLWEKELAARPGDADLEEKVRTARRLAAQRHGERAAVAAEARDWPAAAAELAAAERYDREALPIKRLREVLAPKLAAAAQLAKDKDRARELLHTDPPAAEEILRGLRRGAPDDLELVALLADATRRAESDRAAARAEEAWDAGVRRRAVEHLAAAEGGGATSQRAERLRRRMENDLVADSARADLAALRVSFALASDARLAPSVVETVRDRLATRLRAEIDAHARAGRPATAALFEIECERIGAPAGKTHLDRVRRERAIVIHVPPLDDATGGSVDGMRVARTLRDRVALDAAGGASVLLVTPDAAPEGAAFPHLVVRGTASKLRITSGRVGRETRSVRFVAGTRSAENPAAAELTRALSVARAALAAERERVASAETRLRELEALPFSKTGTGAVGTEGDVAYQSRLAAARAAVEDARRAARSAESEEFGIRQRILATPSTVAQPVWDETAVEVTTLVKTAEMVVRLRLLDGQETLLDRTVTGADVHRETTAPAVPAAGLPEDRDETPDDAAMAARAAERFAESASGDVRAAAVRAANRLLVDARAAEQRGESDAAAETFAAYLLSTPEAATPERADAARALHELLGAAPSVVSGFDPAVRR